MRRGFAPFLVLVLLFSCASARHSGPASTGDSCGVQGTWSGSFAIEGNGIGGPPRADTLDLRLVLMDSAAKVFSKEQGTWMEDKPGRFSLRCAGPNAVIAAIDSDRDSDGIWYESWVITLTVIDADRALVRWVRMVNNTNLPLPNPSSRFSYQGVGVLQRGPAPLNAERAKPETIGELLSALCDGGDAKACHTLARAIDNDDPTRAGELRKRACDLGDRSACEAR